MKLSFQKYRSFVVRFLMLGIAMSFVCQTAQGQRRVWTDKSGRLQMEAEIVDVEGESVRLRQKDGNELQLNFEQLCAADRQYLDEWKIAHGIDDAEMEKNDDETTNENASSEESGEQPQIPTERESRAQVRKMALEFYSQLREENRDACAKFMTTESKKAYATDGSSLEKLPAPSPGKRAIIPGKAEIDGSVAEIPVRVRTGRELHKTRLHLRFEEGDWRVFGISATYPDGEQSLNFETIVDASAARSFAVGQPMPLSGITNNGQPLDMSQFAGRVVLVDFWATWCGPCRQEMENVLANYEKYHERGFDVVAISTDSDMMRLGKFLGENPMPWTVIADRHPKNRESMQVRYGIQAIPALFLLGPDGKVVSDDCRGKKLGAQLEKLLSDS